MNNISFDAYLRDGCGRCEQYQTPTCKVLLWTDALLALRALVRDAGLQEAMKWGSPCYTLGDKNVAMIVSYRDHCALQFFQGAALADPDGMLESPGPNSRFTRLLSFRSLSDVAQRQTQAKAFLAQAIALAHSGAKVAVAPANEPMPEELARRMASNPALKQAFAALTAGRRRSHILHVSGAKQSDTRERRVDRCTLDIFAGRGFGEW